MKGKKVSEARRWFQQAHYDLQAARWNMQGGFHNTVCFLAQQSGEKALKSFLYYVGARRKAVLTHSLVEMLREAGRTLPQLQALEEEARGLDLHYIPSRYPNGLPSGYPHQFYSKGVAEQALSAADKILSSVRAYYETQGASKVVAAEE